MDFRKPPKDAIGLAPISPAPTPEPENTGPRKRVKKGIHITEKPLSITEWDVSPLKIAEQLGSE